MSSLNIHFLSSKRLSGRDGVTSGKENFRPDIRQNFFEKNQNIREFVALKTIEILYFDKYQT